MAKLTREQVMVGAEMVQRDTSARQVARQLGVTEGALRYRLKPRTDAGTSGRRWTGWRGSSAGCWSGWTAYRVTGEGRPVQVRQVYEVLRRDYGYRGSYQGVVRHLRREFPVPPLRSSSLGDGPPRPYIASNLRPVAARAGHEPRHDASSEPPDSLCANDS